MTADRILIWRRGGHVRRYHTEQLIGDHQTVAEHSAHVALILLALHPAPSASLLTAALTHDLGERRTGDMPAPVKWRFTALAEHLREAEVLALEEMQVPRPRLHDDDRSWLKGADLLEMLFFAYEQRALGNCHADGIFRRVHARMIQRRDDFPIPIYYAVNDLGVLYDRLFGAAELDIPHRRIDDAGESSTIPVREQLAQTHVP